MGDEQNVRSKVTLNVKLVSDLDASRSREVLSSTPGLKSMIQTFPDEKDPELANLYVVEVSPSAVDTALKQLSRNPYVEYAEETAGRKLIR